jgi:hypothetical protein
MTLEDLIPGLLRDACALPFVAGIGVGLVLRSAVGALLPAPVRAAQPPPAAPQAAATSGALAHAPFARACRAPPAPSQAGPQLDANSAAGVAQPARVPFPREELKMVLCVNQSLGMGKGKIGARRVVGGGRAGACR